MKRAPAVPRLTPANDDFVIKKLGDERRSETPCSKCGGTVIWRDYGGNNRLPPRYCRPCHAAYMREWREAHPDGYTKKHKARAIAGVYRRRKKLVAIEACESCGDPTAEMHHLDYDRPLEVLWLCRRCDVTLHRMKKRPPAAQVAKRIELWISRRRPRKVA